VKFPESSNQYSQASDLFQSRTEKIASRVLYLLYISFALESLQKVHRECDKHNPIKGRNLEKPSSLIGPTAHMYNDIFEFTSQLITNIYKKLRRNNRDQQNQSYISTSTQGSLAIFPPLNSPRRTCTSSCPRTSTRA